MLNNIGLPGILLIAVVVLVLFGRGKIADFMGEFAQGIKSFKKGLKEEEPGENAKVINQKPEDQAAADFQNNSNAGSENETQKASQ